MSEDRLPDLLLVKVLATSSLVELLHENMHFATRTETLFDGSSEDRLVPLNVESS